MSEPLIIDAVNRERALDLSSFIVEAPAGSGKTELLTQRFLKLLCYVQEPEEIIAITFTNKAAAEMRSRILDSLQNAAIGKLPEKPHKQTTHTLSLQALQHAGKLNWRLMENPARLRIFTIDSLCAHLSRQMPLMSRFGAQPKVTEDAQILYAQAASQTLGLLDDAEHGETVQTALRYFDNDATRLQMLMVSMLESRDQWLHQAQREVDIAAMQRTLQQLIELDMRAAAQLLPLGYQQSLMPIARYAASNLPPDNPIAALLDWETPLAAKVSDLPLWQAVANLLLTNEGTPRKEGGLNAKLGLPPTDEGKAKKQALLNMLVLLKDPAPLHAIRNLPDCNADAGWAMISALSRLLSLATAQLWLIFQRTGEVDFTEIAERAKMALGGEDNVPTDLALRLDYQISHLLVDEFQDTSPGQITLLERLTGGWQAGDGRTLFCVGDPMQSIYRFRKANVSLFINAAINGIGDVRLERLQLYRNNRSCPAIVEWINTTFHPIFAEADDPDSGAIRFRESHADPSKHRADSGIEVHPLIKPETAEEARLGEANKIIEIILRERAEDTKRKIAVLVSAKKHLSALVSQLRRTQPDIKFQAVEIEALQGRQVVQDLLALTYALHHRADRVHWLATLRAPWCGLTLADLHAMVGEDVNSTIWSLMQNEVRINGLSSDGQSRLRHVRDIFEQAFLAQGRIPISRWIRGVWLKLGGAGCLWEQADIIDVQAFFKCVDNLERHNEFSLERMKTEIEKLFAAPDTEGELLQMMTIHKSKGLEFDTVILPGLGATNGGNNDNKPLILWEEATVNHASELLAAVHPPKSLRDDSVSAYDYLQAREQVRDTHENVRRLYVAATRAERKLHLVATANQKKDGVAPLKNSLLELLWPAIGAEFQDVTAPESEMADEADISTFIPSLVRMRQASSPVVLQPSYLPETSPSGIGKAASDENTLASDMGTLAHRYLQIIALQGVENWADTRIASLRPAMRQWLKQRGHTQTDTAASQIVRALQATLQSSGGQWILQAQDNAQNEYALISADGDTHVIDRTFTENGTRWVIDYKLGLDVTEHNARTVAQTYLPQLERYAGLFSGENLPIKKAILFLNIGLLITF